MQLNFKEREKQCKANLLRNDACAFTTVIMLFYVYFFYSFVSWQIVAKALIFSCVFFYFFRFYVQKIFGFNSENFYNAFSSHFSLFSLTLNLSTLLSCQQIVFIIFNERFFRVVFVRCSRFLCSNNSNNFSLFCL